MCRLYKDKEIGYLLFIVSRICRRAVLFLGLNLLNFEGRQADEIVILDSHTFRFAGFSHPPSSGAVLWSLLRSVLGCSVSAIFAVAAVFTVSATK